jgi:two-component system, OmpR family, phosphate regulon sensor histidine kinase PhoR
MAEEKNENLVPATPASTPPPPTDLQAGLIYRPAPYAAAAGPAPDRSVWRTRFELVADPARCFGLDINGEVILGRDTDLPDVIDLNPYGAATQGVSRQHVMLRPTPTNLFAIDLGSTNGTLRNGRSIGVNTPYPLVNGDTLSLGGLQLKVWIVNRPSLQTDALATPPDLADALSQIAKAITSQLGVEEVFNQIVETARLLTAAGETAIWLVDENSGELFLEAQRGIEEEKIRRMRLPIRGNSLAGRVIKTAKPFRASRKPGKDQIKVKTGYFVESLVYVPITLGGVTFGVLAASHREPGKEFETRDERLLGAIADFAAIAIQNARLYEATDKALARRVQELAALNEVSRAVSASLDVDQVYDVLVAQVNKHWPVEAVRLYLLDEERTGLRPLRAARGNGAVAEPIDQGILWRVVTDSAVMMSNDAANHPDYVAEVDGINGRDPHSIACIPLCIQERVVGALALYNKADGAFTDEDVSRLEAFANPVATAIENARLFQESERQRAAIQATAATLSQPLFILDEEGNRLVSNAAASRLLDRHMAQLLGGLSSGVGRTSEIELGEQTYLASAQHMPEVGTIVIMQDITYVKQLERDRADFMHVLSHDLKSPLTSIKGFAQLLEKVIKMDERAERYIGRIVAASDRMLEIINQMLQVARADTVETVRQPCDLAQVVAQALAEVEGAALHKEIKIVFTQAGASYSILGDPARLYHMALNLVDNAIKYSPPGTQVTVRLAFSPEAITFQVQDEGPGIPEQELARVFDKYYRGAQANLQPGAGLGLSVVWAIAQAHGGRAMVRNGERGGAEFTVTLPGSLRLDETDGRPA